MRKAYFYAFFCHFHGKNSLKWQFHCGWSGSFAVVEFAVKIVERESGKMGCNSKRARLQCGYKGWAAIWFWVAVTKK